ncbi:MAG: hypothetical protein DSZ26_03395 [Thermovibrio sp.]|nr:MAG: hypothetical protein DSZ26_03395 [Thermovibrio sp.]
MFRKKRNNNAGSAERELQKRLYSLKTLIKTEGINIESPSPNGIKLGLLSINPVETVKRNRTINGFSLSI